MSVTQEKEVVDIVQRPLKDLFPIMRIAIVAPGTTRCGEMAAVILKIEKRSNWYPARPAEPQSPAC
jgi:hypothetical protein